VIEMLVYKLSPAERRLIREQSGLEPTPSSLARIATIAVAAILGTLLALHIAYLTVTSGGVLYAAY
jgi:hypothetical protein